MKSDIAKYKPVAGLFLEALMLVFIFVYSQGALSQQPTDTGDMPLKSVLSFHEITLRNHFSSHACDQVLSKFQITAGLFPPYARDLSGAALALSKALTVSHFERSIFYVTATDNAP
jgi:hypothetical protein